MEKDSHTVTLLLERIAEGDADAKQQLYDTLYSQLSRVARNHLARAGTISLDAPAILHESYLRMDGVRKTDFPNRRAFFTYASTVMHAVIVDYVRERRTAKRGGDVEVVTLRTGMSDLIVGEEDLLQLHEAIAELEHTDARCHQVVQLRFFAGLTEEEIAELLEVSVPTVKRDWYKARAFLFNCLRDIQ